MMLNDAKEVAARGRQRTDRHVLLAQAATESVANSLAKGMQVEKPEVTVTERAEDDMIVGDVSITNNYPPGATGPPGKEGAQGPPGPPGAAIGADKPGAGWLRGAALPALLGGAVTAGLLGGMYALTGPGQQPPETKTIVKQADPDDLKVTVYFDGEKVTEQTIPGKQ